MGKRRRKVLKIGGYVGYEGKKITYLNLYYLFRVPARMEPKQLEELPFQDNFGFAET